MSRLLSIQAVILQVMVCLACIKVMHILKQLCKHILWDNDSLITEQQVDFEKETPPKDIILTLL